VASDSFALTLWTYHQSEEAEYMQSLIREHEDLRMADMIATAFHEPKKLKLREADWRSRAFVSESIDEKSIETMMQEADEIRALHESSRKRLVS
jgi:hypothetical protein